MPAAHKVKTSVKTKTRTSRSTTSRKTIRSQHSRHVRLTLHPLSIFVELCVAVLLIASTVVTYGDTDSYNVSATVPTAAPTVPAIITQPADTSHVTDPTVTVSGSCDGDYVTVVLNGASIGNSDCSGGSFSLNAILQSGANSLSAQDYNVLNEAGPSSTGITVYYDQSNTTQVTPVVAPPALQVEQVDSGISYTDATAIPVTTSLPTFQGISTPFSQITVEVHTAPVYCYTQADANGYWQCTVTTVLPVGEHTVYVSAVTDQGAKLVFPTFHLQVTTESSMLHNKQITYAPLVITVPTYAYKAYATGQTVPLSFPISGGKAPYAVSVSWGDGAVVTYIEQTGSFSASHIYNQHDSSLHDYTIKVQVVDAAGHTTSHQFITYIRDPLYAMQTSAVVKPTGLHGFLSSVHSWLWLLWPSYTIIILMFISFWLGERRQFDQDARKLHKKVIHRKHHA